MSKILFHGILICARQKKHSSKYVEVAACFVTLPACLPWFSKSKDKLRNRKGTKKLKKRMLSIGNFLYFLLEKNGGKKIPLLSPVFGKRAESSDSAHVSSLRSCVTWGEEEQSYVGFLQQHLHTIFFLTTFSCLFRNFPYYFSYVPLVL